MPFVWALAQHPPPPTPPRTSLFLSRILGLYLYKPLTLGVEMERVSVLWLFFPGEISIA